MFQQVVQRPVCFKQLLRGLRTDARNALAVALAAAESAETGLPVEVSAVAELRAAEPELQAAGSERQLAGGTV